RFRGLIGTLTGLSTNIGALIASAFGLPQIFGSKNLWPYGYYMEMIPCLMLICYAIFFLHESPLSNREALFLSILLNCTVSFSGIVAMSFFGTALLGSAGFTPVGASLANCLAGLSGTIGIIIQAVTIDKVNFCNLV
ncbi:unnamed protein product, partial [Onchocerca ochengi]